MLCLRLSTPPPPPRTNQAISSAPWLPKIGIGDETKEQHRQLSVATADFINKTHADWSSSVEPNPLQRLDQPLLTKSLERPGYIEPNFDRCGPCGVGVEGGSQGGDVGEVSGEGLNG